jgi:hypothetical protein
MIDEKKYLAFFEKLYTPIYMGIVESVETLSTKEEKYNVDYTKIIVSILLHIASRLSIFIGCNVKIFTDLSKEIFEVEDQKIKGESKSSTKSNKRSANDLN